MVSEVRKEISRQRYALLKLGMFPKVLYLGEDQYREFKRALRNDRCAAIFVIQRPTDPEPREEYEGMEIIVRLKPGVHVCEMAP